MPHLQPTAFDASKSCSAFERLQLVRQSDSYVVDTERYGWFEDVFKQVADMVVLISQTGEKFFKPNQSSHLPGRYLRARHHAYITFELQPRKLPTGIDDLCLQQLQNCVHVLCTTLCTAVRSASRCHPGIVRLTSSK